MMSTGNQNQSPIAALRRFVRPRKAVERCEMCSTELPAEHIHLIEPVGRQLVCACQACSMLFSSQAGTKYKRVPRRIRYLPNFQLSDAQWEDLSLPINMAFFFYSTPAQKMVAIYPSPAGPTESLLDLEAWDAIVSDNPVLKEMEADVEALLVTRGRDSMAEYFLVPIDECYRLVGLIRAHWRGLSGGTEVWSEIARFFITLKEKAVEV